VPSAPFLLSMSLVTSSCHANWESDSGKSSFGHAVAPREWGARRLCAQGFRVINADVERVDPSLSLGVEETTTDCKIQEVRFSPYDPAIPFSHIFQLVVAPDSPGKYQLHNPRRPYNSLSLSLDARSGIRPGCPDESSTGDSLHWIIQKLVQGDTSPNGDVWFEISPATDPQSKLAAIGTAEGYSLELAERATGSPVPSAQQWRFSALDMCGTNE
jgi:hypothetical protein